MTTITKCEYISKGGMEHRLRNGMWENKCFVNVGKKFLTFTKHMPFRGLSSIPPLLWDIKFDLKSRSINPEQNIKSFT